MAESKGTSRGYHFLAEYQQCRWKWWLHHQRKIVPEKVSRYLTFGSAFHSAKELFYKGEITSRVAFIQHGQEFIATCRADYEHLDQYEEDLVRMDVMGGQWWENFAERDRRELEILAIEEQFEVALPGDFSLTVRNDVIVRNRASDVVYSMETKTTSKGVSVMAKSVACQQQVDAQILAMKTRAAQKGENPEKIIGVMPDIVYSRGRVVQAERTPIINRSKKELADTQLAFTGLFAEIGQKLVTVEKGVLPPEMIFDRNGSWCANVGCDYISICRSRFTEPPPGFKEAE